MAREYNQARSYRASEYCLIGAREKLDYSSSDSVAQLLRDLTGRKQTVLAGRASAAIWACLRARGINGKWVLMPANICYVVAWAVLQSGNLPYLVDIDPLTGNISLDTLANVQVEFSAALIICHMYGLGAPIASLVEWAQRRGIFVIEDAALALGASVDERPAGSWGDISLFSFGEGKIVDVGAGGALLCDDFELAQKVKAELDELPTWSHHLEQLRFQWEELYGQLHQYEEENSQLAMLYPMLFRIFGDVTRYRLLTSEWDPLVKALASLETNLNHRLEMTSLYDEYFRFMQVRTLRRPKGHVVWRYPLLVSPEDRNPLLELLWENDILCSRWYPSLRSMLSALAPAIGEQSSPGADQLGAEIINLGVDHQVDEETIKRATEVVQMYFHNKRKHGTQKNVEKYG